MERGRRRVELLQSNNKISAVNLAKSKFPGAMVIKAVETSAPMEETIGNFTKNLKRSFKKKIDINDKISTIARSLL